MSDLEHPDKVDIKMTWSDALAPLLAVYAQGTPEGQPDALAELRRMAAAADLSVEAQINAA